MVFYFVVYISCYCGVLQAIPCNIFYIKMSKNDVILSCVGRDSVATLFPYFHDAKVRLFPHICKKNHTFFIKKHKKNDIYMSCRAFPPVTPLHITPFITLKQHPPPSKASIHPPHTQHTIRTHTTTQSDTLRHKRTHQQTHKTKTRT